MSPVGVTVTTSVLQPSGGVDTAAPATFFVAGLTERGDPTTPVLVRSMADVRQLLGDRVSYGSVDDALASFFGEGGARAYVARNVGPSATKGTLTLMDRAGTPVATVRVDAANAGSWSSRVTVKVEDGLVTNTVKITVFYDGTIVESYDNLTGPTDIVAKLAGSTYVRAVDLGSATAAPSNNPAVSGPTALSAGNSDRASVTASMMVTSLALFTPDFGTGAVAIPGQPYSTVLAGLAAHAKANRRIALTAAPAGTTVAAVAAAARGQRSTSGAESIGWVAPWVEIPDGSGGVRTISPEGFAAGLRARGILSRGYPVAPFGEAGVARFASGTEYDLTGTDANTLADAAVNPIRVMLGGVRLYDWRSLSADEANWKFLDYSDLVNAIAAEASERLERFVGQPIDGGGHLFSAMENEVEAILAPMTAGGRLFARMAADGTTQVDPGYRLITDSTVNTPQTISQGIAKIRAEVRPSPAAELIGFEIAKAVVTQPL